MKNITDYSAFVLSEYEQSLFDRFKESKNSSVILTREEFKVLRDKGLVTKAINGKTDCFDTLPESVVCTLSKGGKVLRTYQKKQEREQLQRSKVERRKEIREWITLAVAVFGLILSIISISWQIYTWRSERAEYLKGHTAAYTETDTPVLSTD